MVWKESGDSFEKVPLGSHVARCIAVIDLGTRVSQFGSKRDCMIRWELPTEAMETSRDGDVFTVGAFYSQSLSEKANLRAMLKSWRGRDFTPEELQGFDPKKMIGAPCLVNIIEKKNAKGDVNHVVGAVSPVPKGLAIPPLINKTVFLSLEPDQFDASAMDQLSEKQQAMVKESPEWKALQNGTAVQSQYVAQGTGVDDSDVPF
jgi:hypothetical protein